MDDPCVSSNGWTLYYSEDGYPYYYNDITGESAWAQTESAESNHFGNNIQNDALSTVTDNSVELLFESSGDSSSADNESLSIDDVDNDDAFTKDFSEYLKSPRGEIEFEVCSNYQ